MIEPHEAELFRLADADSGTPWRRWGPYLSERQWGTVREDYSHDGGAWDYFTHDHSRSRAYRWGEDGLAGLCDDRQLICFSLALWNGRDPILKERLFGLSNSEGNHGEDVKEYYFYVDSTPSHSYMKYLYKYPQAAFPYDKLVETNRKRTRNEPEYELIDTGVFAEDRYFDVFVEYAKNTPDDIAIRITVANRGPEQADLHLLPTLLFRNTWSPGPNHSAPSEAAATERPVLEAMTSSEDVSLVRVRHPDLGERFLYAEGEVPLLFTDNETNTARLRNHPNETPWVKDAFHRFLIGKERGAINPERRGTKGAAHYWITVPANGEVVVRLRLTTEGPRTLTSPFGDADAIFSTRKREADDFYRSITPPRLGEDGANVLRQALAGMLWNKQYYYYDVNRWLQEHGLPVRGGLGSARNSAWSHMHNGHVISMPDKWEYPWYAAWDLAFHSIALALVDIDFAKHQLDLMLQPSYQHPNGQIPAYEWNFSDVNPPVHAWATWFVYQHEKLTYGEGDFPFLARSFQKLLLNFTWWVNRKDPSGRNVFEGGFLGLDNIGVFDRSAPLPTGGRLEQADGTAWMALFSQNMFEIAVELARRDPLYADMAVKFVHHFLEIASAMDRMRDQVDEMWDETDGFYYDLLRLPDQRAGRLRVRSMVGLLPLCAVTVLPAGGLEGITGLRDRIRWVLERNPVLAKQVAPIEVPGYGGRHLLAILDDKKLRRVLARMLDEREFLSPHGIRALSRYHLAHPYKIAVHGEEYRVDYQPAESNSGMFGGNSNWRGPVWMPVNALILRALLQYYSYYGDSFRIECPTGSGKMMTLYEVARNLAGRLASIFLRDRKGHRPVYGGTEKFQSDPHWRDLVLFYEYFHGDNGAGIGASHQTGWTGTIAVFMQLFGHTTANSVLEEGRRAMQFTPEWNAQSASADA
jgi:hypothetical protein